MADNLYVHFPFCRSRCSYCTLYSRVGTTADARAAYVESIRAALESLGNHLTTLYFGGGSPALCDLSPLCAPLKHCTTGQTCFAMFEFTVELHPLDVTPEKLDELTSIGVNRISMGVQSLDDDVLRAMGRGYTADDAARAFALVKSRFDNAGIDLIVGYPGERPDVAERLAPLAGWGLRHCSVYSLQNERGLKNVPDDDTVLDRIRAVAAFLKTLGLERYEISNYAVPGYECRHNLAVWRGEDYIGLGDGACGRLGLTRTRNWWGQTPNQWGQTPQNSDAASKWRGQTPQNRWGQSPQNSVVETVSEGSDLKERTLFRLRTRDGLDTTRFPGWRPTLDRFVGEGLLVRRGVVYCLTERGTEVCDAILAEIV